MLGMVLSMGGEITLTDLRRFIKGDLAAFQRGKFQLLAAIPDFWRHLRLTIEKKIPDFVHSTIAEDMVRVAWTDIARARATGDAYLIEETDTYWKSFLEEYSKNTPEGSKMTEIKACIRAAIAYLL